MAKKGTKIALTYFITIIITFLVIGGICFWLFREITAPKQKPSAPDLETLAADSYTPSADNNKTTLFIFDSAKRMSGCCFLAVRMLADEERTLVIMPIPADTRAYVNGAEDSLYEFYRKGGAARAVSAAEDACGVKFDYYVKLNNDSFSILVDIFGGVDFEVPYNLIYSDPDSGEETVIREGSTHLDSTLLRKVVTYPLYNSGEEYRAKMMGVAVTDLINKNVNENFANHIDDYYSAVINSTAETNFTAYDYKEQAEAMKYVASDSERVCKLVTVSGSYDDKSLFVLDENFLRSLTERFKLYENAETTEE